MNERPARNEPQGLCCAWVACVLAILLTSPVTLHADPPNCPAIIPGDFDGDGDVDRYDYLALAACAGGAGVSISANCHTADFDGDDDVDQIDFGVFQNCYSGAGQPGNPHCYRLPPRAATSTIAGLEDLPFVFALEGCDGYYPSAVLTATVTSLPALGALAQYDGTPITNAPASVTDAQRRLQYIPPPNRNGTPMDQFTYTLTSTMDAVTSAAATVSVNLTPTPDPPQANNATITTTEDTPVIFSFPVTDPDLENEGDHLTIQFRRSNQWGKYYQVEADNLTRGVQIINFDPSITIPLTNPNGLLWWEPDPNWNLSGQAAFYYSVVDQYGLSSNQGIITFNVIPVNDPPTASPTVSTGYNDAPSCVALLSYGDIDDGVATLCITEFPIKGKLYSVVNGELVGPITGCIKPPGSLVYVKDDPGGMGSPYDSFSYTVTDQSGATTACNGNVINIEYRNLPPELTSPVTAECAEDTAGVEIPIATFDPDGDPVTITLNTLPAHGKIGWHAMIFPAAPTLVPDLNNTTLKYIPDPDFNTAGGVPDSFQISLSDGRGGSRDYTVSVTVHAVNDAPIVSCASWTFGEISSYDGSLYQPADIRDVVVSDVDAGEDLVKVTVSADVLSTGQVYITSAEGLASVQPIDNLHLELQGTLAALNAAFAAKRVKYAPTSDDEFPVITITVNDLGHNGEGPPTPLTSSAQMKVEIWYIMP